MLKISAFISGIIIIAIAMMMPAGTIKMGYHTDKILHMALFYMVSLPLIGTKLNLKKAMAYGGILFCAGVAIECMQTLSPDRSAEMGDIYANTIGIILGIISAHWFRTGYYTPPANTEP